MWWLHLITQNPVLKLEFLVGSNDCQITCRILMTFWRLQCVSCRAIWCSVMETQTLPTHAHQPAPFSPAIQTHSHAFTHLLCPPHEELKIDDSTTTKRGWEKGRKGRKKARGRESKEAQSSSKMRGGERGREEKTQRSGDLTARRRGAERVSGKDERDVRSPGRPAEHNLVLKAVELVLPCRLPTPEGHTNSSWHATQISSTLARKGSYWRKGDEITVSRHFLFAWQIMLMMNWSTKGSLLHKLWGRPSPSSHQSLTRVFFFFFFQPLLSVSLSFFTPSMTWYQRRGAAKTAKEDEQWKTEERSLSLSQTTSLHTNTPFACSRGGSATLKVSSNARMWSGRGRRTIKPWVRTAALMLTECDAIFSQVHTEAPFTWQRF